MSLQIMFSLRTSFSNKNYTWKFSVKKMRISPSFHFPPSFHYLWFSLLLSLTFFPLSLSVPEAPSLKVVTILAGLSNKSSTSKGQQLWTGTYDHRNNLNYPFRPIWDGVGWGGSKTENFYYWINSSEMMI